MIVPILVILTLGLVFRETDQPDREAEAAAPQAQGQPAPPDALGPVAASGGVIDPALTPSGTTAGDDGASNAGAEPQGPTADATPDDDPLPEEALLPEGPEFAAVGAGTWHVVPTGQPAPADPAAARTYTVEVEDGIQPPAADREFAEVVDQTLSDPRSWIARGDVTFVRIDSGEPDFRISLTSQMTARGTGMCGWEVPLEASCYNRSVARVVINHARWVRGAHAYESDLPAYRAYAINHEVGHALGFGHQFCPAPGAPAPVMMQQSWSVSNDALHRLQPAVAPLDGFVCSSNPSPFPTSGDPGPAGVGPSSAG